ncbi:hypothetical protein Glove_463g11 [Diversispora epigaea]|uniref:Uncharacterized protein n=1 Tax=Diversispora epigaea TaxID=1348612 RepID=A0A397GMI5_9GLOM|nr:hypothetical protein Glove_463g11 [Diversispora epigaea]
MSNKNNKKKESENNSNSHENEMLQAETNSLNNTAWILFNRFRVNNQWELCLPKWILLAILEPIDSKEQKNINIESNILKQEFGEIFEAKLIDSNLYRICIDILNRYIEFRQDPKESLKNSILNEIFSILRVESEQIIENNIKGLSIEQRSVLRYMIHQDVQAKIAFIRVTLKNKNYSIYEAEGYHCTKNPYYHKKINYLKKKCKDDNDCWQAEYNKWKTDYEAEKTKYNNFLRENEDLKNKINQLRMENKDFKIEIIQLNDEKEDIRKEAESAKNEATKYQAALGKATNVHWGDDTNNNSIQLTKDIQKLEKNVDDLAKVKGRKYKINEDGALKLLQKYNIQISTEDKQFKLILSYTLQRLVVEFIFEIAKNLYKNLNKDDDNLESNIIYHTEKLVKYSSKLVDERKGDDKISDVTPIKIRQQSYAILALRGFVDDHRLISQQADKLIKEMEQYREIVDIEKQKEFKVETENLIRSGIQLCFILKTQEPVPKIKWYESGNSIEEHAMKGHWTRGEEKSLEVSLCYFPAIIAHDTQDHVYHSAAVIVQSKPSKPNFFQRASNTVVNAARNVVSNVTDHKNN